MSDDPDGCFVLQQLDEHDNPLAVWRTASGVTFRRDLAATWPSMLEALAESPGPGWRAIRKPEEKTR